MDEIRVGTQVWEVGVSVESLAAGGDDEWLTVLVAGVLGMPLSRCVRVAQVGRFCKVAYEPVGERDPDVMVSFDAAAGEFHEVIRDFQALRSMLKTPDDFYVTCRAMVDTDLVRALRGLNPSQAEAVFVLKWGYLTAAKAAQIANRRRDEAEDARWRMKRRMKEVWETVGG